jgi:2-polyprenyl-6-methoxyphenol hydroxylase-like FAD-dependent oxidoreductase
MASVIIAGAGLGGLTAAIALADADLHVTVRSSTDTAVFAHA